MNTFDPDDHLPDELYFLRHLDRLLQEKPLSVLEQEQLLEMARSFFKQLFLQEKGAVASDVEHLLACIHEHLFEDSLNVAWLLEHCGITSSDVHTHFKHELERGIRAYIEDKRLMAAMWLLWWEEIPIADIAHGVGYRNYRSFGRAFQRYVGCSPSRYRERMARRGLAQRLWNGMSG